MPTASVPVPIASSYTGYINRRPEMPFLEEPDAVALHRIMTELQAVGETYQGGPISTPGRALAWLLWKTRTTTPT